MTIYRDSNSDYVFQHPYPSALNVSVFKNGKEIKKIQNINPVLGRFIVKLTYNETQYDGPLEFHWTGPAGFARKTTANVVTPLLPTNVIKTIFDDNKSDFELETIENTVRLTIEAYTGQTFGLSKEVKIGKAVNDHHLALPSTLVSIDPATPGLWVSDAMIIGDGIGLSLPTHTYFDLKQAPPEEYLTASFVSGVIRVPNYAYSFKTGERYAILGEWGYSHVPEDVQEAAKILINDYSCNESIYREKYLDSVKYESTLQFNPMAFHGTGNVRADQILDKYRKIKMEVI